MAQPSTTTGTPAFAGGTPGVFGNPFGGGGIFGANPGTEGGFGSGPGGNKTGTPGPGFVPGWIQNALGQATNLGEQAMTNRYAQLGLSGQGATPTSPGGPAGGIGVGNIGTGALPTNPATTPTAEQVDLGMIPSLTGGIPGEAMATLGEIQTANLQQPSGSGASGGGKGGGAKGAIGPLIGLAAK